MGSTPFSLPSDSSGDVASSLCTAIFEFWMLILQQDSWALTSRPGHLRTTARHNPSSSAGDCDESNRNLDSMYTCAEKDDDIDVDGACPETNDPGHLELNNWNFCRFLLNEERDRLCLWKFNFTNEDLNHLTKNKTSIIGDAVMASLVRIGQALLDEAGTCPSLTLSFCYWEQVTRVPLSSITLERGLLSSHLLQVKHGESYRLILGRVDIPSIDNADYPSEKIRQQLKAQVAAGKELVRNPSFHDDEEVDITSGSALDRSMSHCQTGAPEETPAIFDILNANIGRLQRLSFSITRTLAKMND